MKINFQFNFSFFNFSFFKLNDFSQLRFFLFRKREAEKKKKNSFGNAVYSIRFDEDSEDPPSCFGAKYHFQLEEQVDVAEFLVSFDVLEYICKMEGLKCKHKVVYFDSFQIYKVVYKI